MRARALAAAVVSVGALAATEPPAARRLAEIRDEIASLRSEAARLQREERGVLGELARTDAAIALRRAELAAADLELSAAEDALAARRLALAELDAAQARRAPHLARSLRALYTRGAIGRLRTLLDAAPGGGGLEGARYAGFLARRDASRITAWRESMDRIASETRALAEERAALEEVRNGARAAADALAASRREKASTVARIRGDRVQHERAIRELETAAAGLERVVEGAPSGAPAAIDVRAFRGMLDWPAEGPVAVGYGPMVHPRFKTEVPHPGWDIAAPEGSPFRAVFDGRVAYAASLAGYGLTVVVDHGQDIVSVYAHAGVLLVAVGDPVTRGQELGRVGDSGSLRGPVLYFEVREGGKPANPAGWLRSR